MSQSPSTLFFAGYIGQKKLRAAYCKADVFAFSVSRKQKALWLLEALSCGTNHNLFGTSLKSMEDSKTIAETR